MNEKNTAANEFAVKKITPLFWKYAMLGLAGLILQACSVIADGIFVGNGVGAMGLATIGVVAPIWTVVCSLMGLFGIGGATVITSKLGEGKQEEARRAYASVTIFTFLFSIVFSIVALLNAETIVVALGATEQIVPYALDYVIPFFLGMPLCITGGSVYFFPRAIGKPFASTLSYVVPAILAILFEYTAIFKCDMGMKGSALSWVICVGLSFLLILYLQLAKDGLKLKWSDLKINFAYVWESIKIGFAPFFAQLCAIITTIIINRQIVNYGHGELEIAAYGTINAYIVYILSILCNSLASGILPIGSYNYVTKDYGRVKELLRKSTAQSVIGLTVLLILIFLFKKTIVGFFIGTDDSLIHLTMDVMYAFMPLYSLGLLSVILSGYYQALAKNGAALFTALIRIIISTPLLFILPKMIGYGGLWMAQPVTDAAAFIICIIMIVYEYKRLSKLESKLKSKLE